MRDFSVISTSHTGLFHSCQPGPIKLSSVSSWVILSHLKKCFLPSQASICALYSPPLSQPQTPYFLDCFLFLLCCRSKSDRKDSVLPKFTFDTQNFLLSSELLHTSKQGVIPHQVSYSACQYKLHVVVSCSRPAHSLQDVGLCVWQNTEKQMRQLAVIPPMLFDAEQQRIKFINMNGLMDDPMKVYKDRQVMNMWSEQEKDTFREK